MDALSLDQPNFKIFDGSNPPMSEARLDEFVDEPQYEALKQTILQAEEQLVSQSLIKRKTWMKKYKIPEDVLYELFSEFQSMTILAKYNTEKLQKQKQETERQRRFNKKLGHLLPVDPSSKMSLKIQELYNRPTYGIKEIEVMSFEVPIDIFRVYCNAIKSLNKVLQDMVLTALDVPLYMIDCSITWEQFMQVNCFLQYKTCTKSQEVDFYIRMLNPKKRLFVPNEEIDETLNNLYGVRQ